MVDLSKRPKRKPLTMDSPMHNDEHSRNRRVMTHLKDSLISQLTKLDPSLSLNPRHTSLIKRRLKRLFPSLHTPTHPPYALMIRSAIIELKESIGSTEMAISDFIRREYEDLPWAHAKILNMQLDKLCEIGEIACVAGGRYVLIVDDEGGTEQCEGSSKRKKKEKRRSKQGGVESVEEESEEGRIQMFEKQSQQLEAESQSQDSMLHLETTCSSQPTALTCIPAVGTGLSPARLHLQMPCNGPSESGLDAAAKMSGSLSLNVQECKQDEDPITGHVDHEHRGRKPSKCKQIVDHQGDSLLSSALGDATLIEQELNLKKLDERCLSRAQRGQKLRRNAHRINKTHPQDQAEDRVCSSHPNQKQTSSSSQSAAPNPPVSPTQNSGQQLVVPTSEGPPECMASRGIKLPPTELQQQNYSDIDLVIVSKRKVSLTSENVHDDNQASPKGDLQEDPMSRDSDQKPPKRPRGRPPTLETEANCPGESMLPLDDDIHNEQSPNIKKLLKRHQYGRGRGRGRPGLVRGVRLGLGRGQGRPPKLNQIAKKCEQHLQQEDQDKQHDSSISDSGSSRGTGRGWGWPPKLHGSPIQYDEQSQQEDQAQQHGRGRGRGRPRKLIQSINQCEAQLPQEVQAKPQHVRGRGRGRPPKLKQNTNHCEEQSPDQARGLVNTPSSGLGEYQSLEQKQLHVQSRERCHKSELGEAKPPAALMLGSESRCGSGDLSQSNVDANQNRWRLQPVPGREGCSSLKQNQK